MHSYTGTLPNNRMEQSTDKHKTHAIQMPMLSDTSQFQNAVDGMIPCIRHFRKGKATETENNINGCQRLSMKK